MHVYLLLTIFLDTTGLSETQPVEMLQDQAQCILADYVRTRYIRQPTRYTNVDNLNDIFI